MNDNTRPTVAIWNTAWLPASQTFVLDQSEALERWRRLRIGVRRDLDGLPVDVDRAPFSLSTPGRALRRLSRATGYRGVYDGLLRRSDARLIHAHFGPSGIDVLPVARRLGLPLVVTFHGYDVDRLPSDPRQGAEYLAGLQRLFDQAATLVAVSDWVACRLRALGAPPDKIVRHYIGTSVGAAPDLLRPRSGVVFVGRLIARKGVADLVDAWGALPSDVRSAHPLTVVGFGEERDALSRRAAELGVTVDLAGRRSPAEVHRMLPTARVFCGPSRTGPSGDSEAFGLVFLEAAAHGLPVVAYRHAGVVEAVADGKTGILVDEGNVSALTQALHRVLTDDNLADRLGTAGRERVANRFDLRQQTRLLEEIYDRATGMA